MGFLAGNRREKGAAGPRGECWSPDGIRRGPYMETAMPGCQSPDKGRREPCAGTVHHTECQSLVKGGQHWWPETRAGEQGAQKVVISMDVRLQPG